MSDEPKCPYCNEELEFDETIKGVDVYYCSLCHTLFAYDGLDVINYEPMSDDDYELAKFCRGED